MPDRPAPSAAPDPGLHRTPPITDPGDGTDHPAETAGGHALPPSPGRYELGDEIARGGMGVVYRATDTALGREVAVKVLSDRFGPASTAARRFLDEARIAGGLQHPGVPPVHDLGTLPDGRPFLAMKLVKGRTLDDLIKASGDGRPGPRASGPQRPGRPRSGDEAARPPNLVAVFEAICQAVGFAHAHGVVHRDLKPANVMVGSFGEVQVMDWGLAKVLGTHPDHDPTEGDDTTAAGTEIVSVRGADEATRAGVLLGTPAYLPPEQAMGAVDQVDERSDVFGLGAVLCAILTGQPPYVGADRESTRQLAVRARLDDALTRLDGCGADPELVALCRRCLSPEKADRPADGEAVAKEVAALRAVADERARQAELDRVRADGERAKAEAEAREQRKRRRAQLVLGSTVAAVLGVGAGVSIWQAVRATAAEDRTADQLVKTQQAEGLAADRAEREAAARQEADRQAGVAEAKRAEAEKAEREKEQERAEAAAQAAAAEAARDFLDSVLVQGDPWMATKERSAGPNRTLRDALDAASLQIDSQFAEQPKIAAHLRTTLGRAYLGLGDSKAAEPHLTAALALREKALGPDHRDTLSSVHNLASLHWATGDYPAAEPLFRRALTGTERALGPDHPTTLTSVSHLATLYLAAGDYPAAEKLYKRALAGREKALGPDDPQTLTTVNNLATLYLATGDHRAAEPLLKRAVARQETATGPDHPATLNSVNNLAAVYLDTGDYPAAEPLLVRALAGLEKALGPDHPTTLTSAHNLARLYHRTNDHRAAEPLFRRAVAGREKALGPDHPNTLASVHTLAVMYLDGGNYPAAEPLLKRAVAGLDKALGPDHPTTLASARNLARLYHRTNDHRAAEPLFRRAAAGYEKAFGPDHRYTLTALEDLAGLYRATGDHRAAEPLLVRALAGFEKVHGADHPDTLAAVHNLGVLLTVAGRPAEAVPLLERAYAARARSPNLASVGSWLIDTYAAAGRSADAARVVGEVLAEARATLKPGSPELGGLLAQAGKVLLDLDPAAAEAVLRECLELREKLAPAAWNTANAKSLLGGALLLQGRAAEAEPLLLAGYEGLRADRRSIPPIPQARANLPDAAARLARVYLALGKPEEAAKWRAERAKYPPDTAPRPRPVVHLAPPPREVEGGR